jgi:hypothetical protein
MGLSSAPLRLFSLPKGDPQPNTAVSSFARGDLRIRNNQCYHQRVSCLAIPELPASTHQLLKPFSRELR